MGFFDFFKPKESEFSKMNKEIYDAVTKEFTESGYIKPELLPQMFDKIKTELDKGFGFSNVFSYDDCLTLEEKKNLGLPTRKKISREMMNSLSEEGQKLKDPKRTIEHLFYGHSSIIEKRYTLIEMKRNLTNDPYFLGYKLVAALDYSTCIVCGAYDGKIIKTVAELDEFENRKCCNDTCCGYTYVPIQKGLRSVMSTGQNYAGWFRKLSVQEKKEILGEYYDRYKAGESLKDIVSSFTEETAIKYKQDLNARIELREMEEDKKPKVRYTRLTEEQLQEYRELLIKRGKLGDWITVPENLESEMDVMKKRTPKEQHLRLEHERKNAK